MRSRVLPLFGLFAFLAGVTPAFASGEYDEAHAVAAMLEGQTVGNAPPRFGPPKAGLDAMIRGEAIDNFSLADFTFTPKNDDDRLLMRLRPALTLTPTDHLVAHAEGQLYAFYNDEDFDKISLYQGYLEGELPNGKAALKAGRQEFIYGSTFLLGADTFFNGLTFDAVKLSLKPVEPLVVDFFAGTYAKENSDGIEGELYGVYGAYAAGDRLGIDIYGLLDTGGDGLFHDTTHERTYSVGARLTGKLGEHVALEVEPIYQFGRKNLDGSSHDDIRAFGGHADLSIDLDLCRKFVWAICRLLKQDFQPSIPGRYPGTLFLSYAFGSGDDDENDGEFREFHNPNNDTPLIGDMSVISTLSGLTVVDPAGEEVSASGLHVFTAGAGVDLTEKLNLSLDGHYFRADKTPGGISEDIGFETNLILTYAFNDQISLLLSGNRFFTGEFFRDAAGSGKDINYGYLQMQATF